MSGLVEEKYKVEINEFVYSKVFLKLGQSKYITCRLQQPCCLLNLSYEFEPYLLLWGDSFCGTFLFLMSFSMVFPCRRPREGCDFSRPGHLRSKACSLLKVHVGDTNKKGSSKVSQLHLDLW